MKTIIKLFALTLILNFTSVNLSANESLKIETRDHVGNIIYTQNSENRITVSVLNGDGSPVTDLTEEDFTISDGLKDIKILSVDPFHTDMDIPLNLVIVIDNSLSMKNRDAITPLLEALGDFLKVIRPIDNVTAITFSKKANTFYEHKLNLRTIKTNDISALMTFFEEGFSKNLTTRTYLYDAVLTGMDLLRDVPDSENNILAVFTDGVDNNSIATKEDILSKADEIDHFETYIIDYLPEGEKSEFFTKMTEEYTGNIWKAGETSELIPIFKKLSKLLLHKYVITYRYLFPPKGMVSLNPDVLNFDTLVFSSGKPMGNKILFSNGKHNISPVYELFENSSLTSGFDPDALLDIKERYYNLLNLIGTWMVNHPESTLSLSGYISLNEKDKGLTDLSQKRVETISQYLTEIWQINEERIKTKARMVPEYPEDETLPGGIIQNQYVALQFHSDNQKVSENYTLQNSFNNFAVNTILESEYGIKSWKLELKNNNEVLLTKSGVGDIEKSLLIPQNAIQDEILKSSEHITASIHFTDRIGNELEVKSLPCEITYNKINLTSEIASKPEGSIDIKPDEIKIEEVTTIDTSPMLNFIYFKEGSSDLSKKYIQFKNSGDTNSFREASLRGSDEKYYQVLNIVGKRLRDNQDADITLIGCNSNYGPEVNNLELSYSRASEIKSYLKYMWGIESSRIQIKKQNLPDKPSTNRNVEGRTENQRVEVTSDYPEILKTVISTYIERSSNTDALEIYPTILADYPIKEWIITLRGDGVKVGNLKGVNSILESYKFDMNDSGIGKLDSYDNLTAELSFSDDMGSKFTTPPDTTRIKMLKKEEMIALSIGQKITEKYALILFDFNQSTMGPKNKAILDKIVDRIKTIPDAKVKITGYTDTIGKREYNLTLSKRRADSVFKLIMKDNTIKENRITVIGNGPDNTFYDNTLPEGRALNRTVIIQLEYEK